MSARDRLDWMAECHALCARRSELERQIRVSGGAPFLKGTLARVNDQIDELETRIAQDLKGDAA